MPGLLDIMKKQSRTIGVSRLKADIRTSASTFLNAEWIREADSV